MSNVKYELRAESSVGKAIPAATPQLREVEVPSRKPVPVAPAVEELTPYETVTSQAALDSEQREREIFKLDWNESTVPASPEVKKAIAAHMTGDRGLNWYPSLGSENLCDALVDYTGLPSEQLMVTNGSDDALNLICCTYLSEGDEVVAPVPTYNHFTVFAESRGADLVKPCTDNPFDKKLDEIRDAVSDDTRLLYLVSPNNPTGTVYQPEEIEALCREFPETLIILDEAYYEFAQVTGIELVRRHPNLIVTRTFSKAFGLAGLRVGYLAAHPEIVDGLSRIYNPKSVNTLGQIGAMAALDDLEYLDDFLTEVDASKAMLAEFFEGRDCQAHITPANFVVVRVPDIEQTLQKLEARDVYVRDRSDYPGLDNCLRMSVGTADQTARLIERIDDVF